MSRITLLIALVGMAAVTFLVLSPRRTLPVASRLANNAASRSERSPAHATHFSGKPVKAVLPSVDTPEQDWAQFDPRSITVSLPRGAMTFERVKTLREDGATTWIGRNGTPFASFVGVGKGKLWFGVVALVDGTYEITIDEHGAHIADRSNEHLSCGGVVHELPSTRSNPLAMASESGSTVHPQYQPGDPYLVGDPTVHPSGGSIHTLDIAFFYSPETEADVRSGYRVSVPPQSDPQGYLEVRYRATVAACNLMLEQSGVPNFQWRYVGMYETPAYTPKPDPNNPGFYLLEFDLQQMTTKTTIVGEFVDQKMNEVSADEGVFLVGANNNRNHGGLAQGYEDTQFCAFAFTGNNITLAHEVGHNCGLRHDRASENANDNDGHYYYGYVLVYDGAAHGIPAPNNYVYNLADVMAQPSAQYSPTIAHPFFSNPDLRLNGLQLAVDDADHNFSDPNRYAFGVQTDQPKAASAVRWLTEIAPTKSHIRTPAGAVFPAVTIQPPSVATAVAGGSVQLSVAGSGTNLTYQWRKDGIPIAGATDSTLTLDSFTSNQAGHYDAIVGNDLGAVITSGSTVTLTAGPVTSKLINISTRSTVGTSDNVQIAGFVVGGDTPKTVLIRAAGPALAAVGLGGGIADPALELHYGTSVIATNDDWSTDATTGDQIRTTAASVGAFGWPQGSKDAAILITLKPGLYSAVVTGKNGDKGIALVEVYEVTEASGHLINISTRSPVAMGDGVQIAGFVIGGDGPKTVLVRASGPALTAVGFPGGIGDPTLELHDAHNVIAYNDDWSADPTKVAAIESAARSTGAFGWQRGSKDAALLITLSPGLYSAVVSGKGGDTGVALIEVYEVP